MTLNAAQVALRYRRITELVIGRGGRDPVFVAGLNVDPGVLPEIVNGMALPRPSIEHSVAQCEPCGAGIWLGPVQIRIDAIRLCYLCVVALKAIEGHIDVDVLNPANDAAPRRR